MRVRVVLVVLLLLAAVIAGCHQPPPLGASRSAQEDDIREAVFRYQFRHYGVIWPKVKIYFLDIGRTHYHDPSDQLMKRFVGYRLPVRKVSQSVYKGVAEGVRDKETGAQGLIFSVVSIRWVTDIEVEVKGGYFANGRAASCNTYHVVRKNGRWVVVKDIVDAIA